MIARAHLEMLLWAVLLASVLIWLLDTCLRG